MGEGGGREVDVIIVGEQHSDGRASRRTQKHSMRSRIT
jgi:hypothetical protein